MIIGTKLICIKNISIINKFWKGNIYTIDIAFPEFVSINNHWFRIEEPGIDNFPCLYEHFITLAEFRENRINSILSS